jgi:hypothetical protein
MEAFRELGPIHAGGTVASGAALLGEGTRASLYPGGIIQIGRRLVLRMTFDRSAAHLDQSPPHDSGIFHGTGYAIEAAKEEYRGAKSGDYRKCTDRW